MGCQARKKLAPWLVVSALCCGMGAPGVLGQVTPEEHAKHHPGASGTAPAVTPGPAQAAGAMQGMEQMMEGMHSPPPKQLYPTLMELPELPPEKRAEVQRAAHERMTSGTDLMAQGLDQLVKAAPTDNYEAMQAAIARLREGLARFDSGLAAHQAIAEGKDPRAIATKWFKSQMNLPGPPAPAESRGVWGLSWEHLIGMAILIAFAVAMIGMYFLKMRRAASLMRRLSEARPSPWSGSLRVARIFPETPAIKTFRLVDPTGGAIPFGFLPGQFVTLTIAKDGKTVKRSYTIASSAAQRDSIDLTIKREDRGIVSRHLHDEVREGELLQVAAPQGYFTFTGTEADSIVLIGAGVGITPLMCIVRSLADRAWTKDIYLIVSCRTIDDHLYRQELELLQARHPNLHVMVTMTRAESAAWNGLRGRLTKEMLTQAVPELRKRRIHICGPNAMMDGTRAMLLELGVPGDQIKTEAFGPAEKPHERQVAVQTAMAEVTPLVGPTVAFTISGKAAPLPPGTTVLEAAEHVGVSIDASCRAGTCGTCKVKLRKGSVTMAVQDSLAPDEKARGIVLACQAMATESIEVEA